LVDGSGESEGLPFESIFNAISLANMEGADYTEFTVNIYLLKGDHYILRKDYD
jgi:hypothetical protein